MSSLGKYGGICSALFAGLVPEVRAQVSRTPAGTATPSATDLPPLVALPVENQNALYIAALSDRDVSALVASLGGSMRLDPPTNSASTQLDDSNSCRLVTLPVTPYGAAAPSAYIVFGSATTSTNGQSSAVDVRGMVTSAGAVTVAAGGQVMATSRPEWNNMLWAATFPEEYLLSLSGGQSQNSSVQRRTTGGARWNRSFLRRTMQADNSARGVCRRNCARQGLTCLLVATGALSTGLFVGFWCLSCTAAAITGTVATGGAAAPTLLICQTPCAIATAAVVAATVATTVCTTVIVPSCLRDCDLIPPDRTV